MAGGVMTVERAAKVLGINIKKDDAMRTKMALSLGSHGNTPDETERLEAVSFALDRWVDFSDHCRFRREGTRA